jgi:superfamily II DNA or RNA helicase
MAYLGKKGYTIYKESYSLKELNQIRNDMNVKPYSPHSVAVVEYPIYRESKTKMYLPRYYGLNKIGPFTNKLSMGEEIDIEFKGELFDYQHKIIQKYIDFVGESGGGLLDVEPGKGKTVMALNIISRLKRKTLVIVHKTFLMNQWIERIETFLPNARVGKIQGDIIDVEDKDIVLGMLQSLTNSSKYSSELWDQFGLCVFDECHHLSAEVFSEVMREIVTNYNLGLSGTMKRKDGLSRVFEHYIGPIIHKEQTDITTEVLVKSVCFQHETLFDDVKTDFRGQPLYSTMINKLNCPDRIRLIINIMKYELKLNPNQQIMILSNTKQLIEDLHDNMVDMPQSKGYYVGGMKEEALKETEKKDIILATYSMASEGLDIKTLTTLIMASPKSDVCQSVGRILRSKHSAPLVIDIIDPHTVFQNQYKKRCTYYKSKNFKVQHFKTENDYINNKEYSKEKSKKSTCLIKI